MSEPYLIDNFDGGLVLIPRGEARRFAALNHALASCDTWEEFLNAISGDQVTTRELEQTCHGEPPAPEEPFEVEQIPGFANGDWPALPKREMLNWLPESSSIPCRYLVRRPSL